MGNLERQKLHVHVSQKLSWSKKHCREIGFKTVETNYISLSLEKNVSNIGTYVHKNKDRLIMFKVCNIFGKIGTLTVSKFILIMS